MLETRDASEADLDPLMALDTVCFARPWPREAWMSELAPRAGTPLVTLGYRGAEPVGFLSAPVFGVRCELRRIGVAPEHRGRGWGRDLLSHAIARAAAYGCDRIELEVAADNTPARALYARLGFQQVGRRPRYYAGEGRSQPVDAILMDCATCSKTS